MFNGFDILALVCIALFAYLGFRTGFIASVFFCFSGFAGMWAAARFAPRLGAGFVVAFILAAAVILALGFAARMLVKAFLLGIPDRVAGLALGAAIGAVLLVSVAVPASENLPKSIHRVIARSATVSTAVPRVRAAAPWLPVVRFDRLREAARHSIDEAKKRSTGGLKLILKKDKIEQ